MVKLNIILEGETTKKEVEYFFSFIKKLMPFEDYRIVKPKKYVKENHLSESYISSYGPKDYDDFKKNVFLTLCKSDKKPAMLLRHCYKKEEETFLKEGIFADSWLNWGGWVQFTKKADPQRVAIVIVHELAHAFGLVKDTPIKHGKRCIHCEEKGCTMHRGAPAATFCKRCFEQLATFF